MRYLNAQAVQKAERLESEMGREFHRVAVKLLPLHVALDERGAVEVPTLIPPRPQTQEPVVQPQTVVMPQPVAAPQTNIPVPVTPEPESLEPAQEAATTEPVVEKTPRVRFPALRLNTRAMAFTVLAAIVVIGVSFAGITLATNHNAQKLSQSEANQASGYAVSSIKSKNLPAFSSIKLGGSNKVYVDGQLNVSNGLVLAPTITPSAPTAGQFYFDQTTKQPYYFNGSQFISLSPQHVTSLGGAAGLISLGSGLQVTGNQLDLASSLLQSINGAQTILKEPLVTSIQGVSGAVSLTAGNGIAISGTTISNNGVVGLTSNDNSLQITPNSNGSYDLSVVAGGSGNIAVLLAPNVVQADNSNNSSIHINKTGSGHLLELASNGVDMLVADKTGALTLGGSGSQGSLVLNDGSGHLTTINGGTVNQTITFPNTAGSATVCVSSGNCSSSGTAGGDLTGTYPNPTIAKLQGTTLTISSLNNGDVLQYNGSAFVNGPISGVAYLSQNQTFTGHNTFKNAGNSATSLEVENSSGSPILNVDTTNGRVGVGTAGPGYALDVQNGDINTTGIYRVNGSPISSTNLSNDANLAKLNGNQTFSGLNTFSSAVAIQAANSLTLGTNSNLGSLIFHDGTSSNTGTLQLAGSLAANATYNLPVASGTQTVCTVELGNCAGSGTGVTGSGSINQIAKFTGSQAIGNSSLSDDGTTFVVSDNANIQGSSGLTLGKSGVNGQLVFKNSSNTNTITLQSGVTTGNLTLTLPTADGSNGDCLKTNGSAVLVFTACTGGAGGGVTSINSLTGVLTLQGTANQINVASGGSTITLSLPQNINTASNLTVRTITANGQATTDNLITANAVAGSTGNLLDLQVNGSSKATVDSNGNLNITGLYEVGGTQITSANLSNDANLAKLNGTGPQTFTGNNKFTGTVLVQPASDSVSEFQVLNHTGSTVVLNADTTNNRVGIGTGTPGYPLDVNGDVNTNGVYRINGNTVCSASGCSAAAGSGNYIQNGTSLQASANFNIQSVAANSVGGIIRGAASQTADLFDLQTNTPATVFSVGATGSVISQNSSNSTTAFQIQNAAGNSNLFVADTANSKLGIATAPSAGGASLQVGGDISLAALDSANTSTYLCRNSSNQIATCNTSGAGTAFIQGGNSFGATGELGTNDNNALNFRTNNTDKLQLDTSGNLTFQQASTISNASAASGTQLTIQGGAATSGTNGGGNLLLEGGAGASTGSSGSIIVKSNGNNSATAFQVQNAAGTSLLTADTTNMQLNVANVLSSGTIAVQGADGGSILIGTVANSGTGANALTFSGNEITDSNRATNVQGDGRQPPDSSTGIWEATTNLVKNGNADVNSASNTAQAGGSTTTWSRDTGRAKFGSTSFKITPDGLVGGQGLAWIDTAGAANQRIPVSPNTTYTESAWVEGATGTEPLQVFISFYDNSGTFISNSSVNAFTAITAFKEYTVTGTAPANAAGAVTRVMTNGAVAATFWVGGMQFEQKGYATPYVDTTGTATASRSVARVQAPATNVLSSSAGWVAARVRMGVASSASTGSNQDLFSWDDGTNNNRFQLLWGQGGGTWETRRVTGGTLGNAATIADSFNAGDMRTVILKWDASNVYISVNGSNFTSAANNQTPSGLLSTFNIGANGVNANSFDGDVMWLSTGTGSLSNADAASLNNYGNSDPSVSGISALDGSSSTSFVWNGEAKAYTGTNNAPTMQSGITIGDASLFHSGSGALAIQGGLNSTTAFTVQNATGTNELTVDTTNQQVAVGPAAVPGNGVLTVGTNTTTATGGIYFGTDTNLYRSASNILKTDGGLVVGTLASASSPNTYLCINSSQLASCSTTANGAAFVQGGNSFGSTATLGTTDANALTIGTYNGTSLQQRINITNTASSGNNATLTFNGSDLFKSTANSSSAFQIQNASSVNLFQVDTASNNIIIGGNNSGELQSWQTASNTLPNAIANFSPVVANGYVYTFGGILASNTDTADVYYAKLNSDGSVGGWTTSGNALPSILQAYASAAADGYVYIIGGNTGTTGSAKTSVYYSKLNPDGSNGSWVTASNSLPASRYNATRAVANGYMYIIGGIDSTGTVANTVYYARLNPDGSVGSWSTSGNNLPASLDNGSTVVANGYVYYIGGANQGGNSVNSVYYAKLNSDGSIGSWTTSGNTLPANLGGHTSVISNGYVYVLGGNVTGSIHSSTVYYARLNSDGSIGSWSTAANNLPSSRFHAGSVVANGYVYEIGGADGTPISQSTVYYASTERVQIGGSLDLVGLSGQNLADGSGYGGGQGSVGGSLTAGNTNIVGALQVQGLANFAQNVSVNGSFNVVNSSGTSVLAVDVANNSLTVRGSALFQNSTDSTSAFQIQNSAGTSNLFDADTTNSRIGIGTNAPGNLLSIGALTTAQGTYQVAVSTGGTTNGGIVIQDVASQSSGNLLQAEDSTGATLASIDYQGNLSVKAATITGNLTLNGHLITGDASISSPTVGTALGTGGSPACSFSGNQTSGKITITAGTTSLTTGTACTGTISFGASPHPVISAADQSSAALQVYMSANTTTFTIGLGVAPTASQTYTFYYFNAQ